MHDTEKVASSEELEEGESGANLRIALLLGCVFAPLWLATYQVQVYGDGLTFMHRLEESTLRSLTNNHLLHLPLARLLQGTSSLVSPIGAEASLKATAALAGAVGVGLAYLFAWEVLASRRKAVICALLLAGLQGYWFHSTVTEVHSLHTACSLMLLLALTRILRGRTRSSRANWVLLVFGIALTPGSHVGGLCSLLPITVTFLLVPAARGKLLGAFAVGGTLFGATYLIKSSMDTGFSGYTSAFLGIYGRLLGDPSRLPGNLRTWVREFASYALPAACLVPAGLRLLIRSDRKMAWLLLSWLLAWTLIAIPIKDLGTGGYYIPTFPVQALLAIIAFDKLAVDGRRTTLVLVLAASPAVILATLGSTSGYLAIGCSATLLLSMARPASDTARLLYTLPATAFLLSALAILPQRASDPHRERLRAVLSAVQMEEARSGKSGLMIFLGTHLRWSLHWKAFAHNKLKDKERIMNPLAVMLRGTEARQIAALDYRRKKIERALARGRAVWLVGSPVALFDQAPPPAMRDFLMGLCEDFEMQPAGDRLFRLALK